MAKMAWDRLLETCLKRKMSLVLAADSIPVVCGVGSILTLDIPPISADELASMLGELVPREEKGTGTEVRTFTVRYGSEFGFLFEVRGEPKPDSITVSQLW